MIRRLALPATAAMAVVLLAACSSSNNKKSNANAANAANQAASVAAGLGSPTAAAVATIVRTPTPAPLLSARTATPAAAATRNGGSGSGSSTDAALSQALQGAALKPSDLPSGFSSLSTDTQTTIPNQTAGYTGIYGNLSALPNVGLVVDSLLGFKDTSSAQAEFKNLQTDLATANGADSTKLTPVSNPAKIGDETQIYTVSLTQQGFTFNGYLVAWRRGRLGGTLAVAGTTPSTPASLDQAIALAQKQDGLLAGVKQ